MGFILIAGFVFMLYSGSIPMYHGMKNMTMIDESFGYRFEIEEHGSVIGNTETKGVVAMRDTSHMTKEEVIISFSLSLCECVWDWDCTIPA